MIPSSTRTLLFGIFVLARRRLTATQVIALARPLGVSATNVKSHLTRLVADGSLERSGPARRAQYWPSARQGIVVEGIAARLEETPAEPWDHTWLMLTLRMPSRRAEREGLRAALGFDGFRPCGPSTFVRPDWPKPWALDRTRRYLAHIPGLSVRGPLIGSMTASAMGAIYGLDLLDREARRLVERVRRTRIPSESARAFAARLAVGGRVARLVGHDPHLPAALWGGRRGLRQLVQAYRRFEERIAPVAQRFLDGVVGLDEARARSSRPTRRKKRSTSRKSPKEKKTGSASSKRTLRYLRQSTGPHRPPRLRA